MFKTMTTGTELYAKYGNYRAYRVDYSPSPRSDTESWYTIQPGNNPEQEMKRRYPADCGYSFVRIDSIPIGEQIIEP